MGPSTWFEIERTDADAAARLVAGADLVGLGWPVYGSDLPERCGRCVRICPSGNLTMTPDGIDSSGTCVLCVRCYNYCPVQAVLYMGRPHRPERGLPYRGPVAGFRPEALTADR